MADRASQAGRALQLAGGKCCGGPQRGEHPPAVDEFPAAPRQSTRSATRFRGDCRGRAQRRAVCGGGFFAGRGKIVDRGARGNCRRETSVTRAAVVERSRATRGDPAFWITATREAHTAVVRPALRDARPANAAGFARTENSNRQVPFRGGGRLSPATPKSDFPNYRIAVLLFE